MISTILSEKSENRKIETIQEKSGTSTIPSFVCTYPVQRYITAIKKRINEYKYARVCNVILFPLKQNNAK